MVAQSLCFYVQQNGWQNKIPEIPEKKRLELSLPSSRCFAKVRASPRSWGWSCISQTFWGLLSCSWQWLLKSRGILTKELKYEVSPHWTMGHNFIPRSTVSSSWASTYQESWHILKPTTRDSKEVLLMNTIWGIWIRGTVSSPGPVHLSLHSLLLLLIKETTISAIVSKLYIGELHKGPMLRNTTTFRNVEGDTRLLPAGCTNKLLSRASFEPFVTHRLERYWWAGNQAGAEKLFLALGWDLTAPSVRTQNTKLRTSSLFRACWSSLKSGQWQIQRPETRAIKKDHNEILQLTTFRWNWSRDTVSSLGQCGHSYIHMVCCVCGIFMRFKFHSWRCLVFIYFQEKVNFYAIDIDNEHRWAPHGPYVAL